MKMSEITCRCKECNCNCECEFYENAIKPVIKVLEEPSYDLTDYTSSKYLNSLKEVVENFWCDCYE